MIDFQKVSKMKIYQVMKRLWVGNPHIPCWNVSKKNLTQPKNQNRKSHWFYLREKELFKMPWMLDFIQRHLCFLVWIYWAIFPSIPQRTSIWCKFLTKISKFGLISPHLPELWVNIPTIVVEYFSKIVPFKISLYCRPALLVRFWQMHSDLDCRIVSKKDFKTSFLGQEYLIAWHL